MKSLIQRAVANAPGMNTLTIGILLVGAVSLFSMRREVFPEFDLEIVLVTVPYPGASPAEIEDGICEKVEEAVRSIAGIKKISSVAQENSGFVILELETYISDVQKVLSEVESEVDRIPSFPDLAEDPEIQQITLRQLAIRIGVSGPDREDAAAQLMLRKITEEVRRDLVQQKTVSQANIVGARDYQIDIEISESTLRQYGLTLQEVAQVVRRENVELPSGTLKSKSQDVRLRGKNKFEDGDGIATLPLVRQPDGTVLTVGDLATVRDEFADTTAISRINGRPGLVISIDRTAAEDLLAITETVHEYVATKQLPPGYTLDTWADASVDVRDRMELLGRNGLQGLALVFLVLAVFLELRLAFWVALGVPISLLGGCVILLAMDQTLNMLSMFAFLMALGIVVDDAIVVGENIYAHRQRGKSPFIAAIDGTFEVLPAVTSSVATTIVAFMPLLFVSGVMGKFIAVLPLTAIIVLAISLFESAFILPSHLAHISDGSVQRRGRLLDAIHAMLRVAFYPLIRLGHLFQWINGHSNEALRKFVERYYVPLLRWSIDYPATMTAAAVALLILTAGIVGSGITPWILMPKLDSKQIEAKIVYPDGTPAPITDEATQRIEKAIREVNDRYAAKHGHDIVTVYHRAVGSVSSPGALGPDTRTAGSHVGNVAVELIDPSDREVNSQEIIDQWREAAGDFPGVEQLVYRSPGVGPGGTPIEFKILADARHMEQLESAIQQCKDYLDERPSVRDISDDSQPGKWELQLKVKDDALAMGVSTADLAETVRAAYYGEEVMRLQRGRHEVKLMVRYPREQRRSLTTLGDLRVRMGSGAERPLDELAKIDVQRGYSEINRVDQQRSITISADIDEARASAGNSAAAIVAAMREKFIPGLLESHPDIAVRWEGQQEQSEESIQSLVKGLCVAVLAMFFLLTVQFRSYLQPLMVLAIIPFGVIGAIVGHALLGLPVTLFSLFGLVALTGVVVNDSIVLIDFINKHADEGRSTKEALVMAGRRRFRPVLLTSLTTIAGLVPILTERSFQAQILIPMVASICFGLLLTTVLVLVLTPTFFFVYACMAGIARFEEDDPSDESRQPAHIDPPQPETVSLVRP